MKSVVASFASAGLLLAACGGETVDDIPPGEPQPAKVDPNRACTRLADLCSTPATECSRATDQYDRLTDEQKVVADEHIDCVMSANDCAAVHECSRAARDIGAELACEHMKTVCVQLESADCTRVNEQYAKLSPPEKMRADKQINCMLGAVDCDAIAACAAL